MKLSPLCLICALLFAGLAGAPRPVSFAAEAQSPQPPASSLPASPLPAGIPMNDLETKFSQSLAGAALVGYWRLIEDGKLGEERAEKYSIRAATKIGDDNWIILARVQYGNRDATVPVPVQVKWAGDTPVISITNLEIPGLGTYSARVLIHDQLYTGSWSGPKARGVMQGTVQKE